MTKKIIFLSLIINLFFAISTVNAQTDYNQTQEDIDIQSTYIPNDMEDIILYHAVVMKVLENEEYQKYIERAHRSKKFQKRLNSVLNDIKPEKRSNTFNKKLKREIESSAKSTMNLF